MRVFEKHMAAIEGNAIERVNIIGLRKAINAVNRSAKGYSVSCTSPKVSFNELDILMSAIHKLRPQVVKGGELHNSGVKVLRNPRYRNRWTDRQKEIIETLVYFRLVDFVPYADRGRGAVPVFEVVSPLGSFEFVNVPWQSGGNGPEIMA